jgi:MFS family permease
VLHHSAQHKRQLRRLIGIFAALYFVQGTCEPTDGLISQPLRSMLLDGGTTPDQAAQFMALVGLPWAVKPFYGLAVDLVPLFGARRKAWMILSTSIATIGLTWLAIEPPTMTPGWTLAAVLVLPTFGVALGDVVTDALMVETGQPLGATGTLQSAQWTAANFAGIAVGPIVGLLTENDQGRWAFAVAAALSASSLVMALFVIRDPPPPTDPPEPASFRGAIRASFSPRVLRAALFLFLVAFNPFTALEYNRITRELDLGELHYGLATSVFAIFAVVSSAGYGWAAERFEVRRIAHVSMGASVLVTFAIMLVHDAVTNYVFQVVSALAWTSALLLQLDVAARLCPPRYAGTVFAFLMAVMNGTASFGEWIGGELHARMLPSLGETGSYNALVVIAAFATALAWGMVPQLARDHALAAKEESDDAAPGATA